MQAPLKKNRMSQPPEKLISYIQHQLDDNGLPENWGDLSANGLAKGSAVLFLLTQYRFNGRKGGETALLLNKRSRKVRQPGDLCCPGGGVSYLDKALSNMLRLPRSPLYNWPPWRALRKSNGRKADRLAMLLTTGLREAWEEMRLNPLQVSFLGLLPAQQLIMFDRMIYPLVGWVTPEQRFIPNWEVERIIHIPLRRLLDHRNYGRFELTFQKRDPSGRRKNDFPCFLHQGRQASEVLWGATFRITMDFLRIVFDFSPPVLSGLPVINGHLGKTYLDGSRWDLSGPPPRAGKKKE